VTRLSRAGEHFDDGMDPDDNIRPDADPKVAAHFYDLQTAGFARAGSALRHHVAAYRAALAGGVAHAAERLVATQMRALEGREARLAAWKPSPPKTQSINWLVPGGLLVLLALIVLLVRTIARRARRKRT